MSSTVDTSVRFDAELWLAERMREHGVNVEPLAGMEPDERREIFRKLILRNGLSSVVLGKRQGKTENYVTCFRRIFGESL